MRFMIIVKATRDSEAGVMPEETLFAEMAEYHEKLARAGALLDASGLQPSSRGWRIKYSAGKRTVVDGPFAETKELVAGYTIIQVKSREEAMEWTRRFPNPAVDGKEGEIEVRQFFELDDFAPSEAIDRFRKMEAARKKAGTGGLKVATPADREIVMTRAFDAPRTLVFDAWTDPGQVPLWMLGPEEWTMPVCEVDLRVGGAWHFAWRHSDGAEMETRGVYREIDPPGRLVTTESWGGDWPETTNTLVLSEEDGKTTVTLTILYPSKEARDAALRTGMTEGVSASFDRLAGLLASADDQWTEGRAKEA